MNRSHNNATLSPEEQLQLLKEIKSKTKQLSIQMKNGSAHLGFPRQYKREGV